MAKILLVDDTTAALKIFVPLISELGVGEVVGLEHHGESAAALVEEIEEARPDVLLLDYNLAGPIKGVEVARELLAHGFGGLIVGFSSVDVARDFKAAGVSYFVFKNIYQPERSVAEIKRLLSAKSDSVKFG